MIHIKEFLDCIPQLSSYFIPGFIFLYVRQYAQIKEVKKIDFSYRAIIASFIIKAFVDTLFQIKFFVNAPLSVVYLTYYIVAALAPILEFALRNTLWANRLFRDTFQLSLTTDIWARTIGTDGKSCLRVYLNSDISIMGVPKCCRRANLSENRRANLSRTAELNCPKSVELICHKTAEQPS